MNKNTIGVSYGTIEGLEKKPFHFDAKCCWAWSLIFTDRPHGFYNLGHIYMADNQKDATTAYYEFKKSFDKLKITDGDTVAIIYDYRGLVIAIGKNHEDLWIDTRDKFKVKTFKDLNLSIDSLVVSCDY